MTITLSGLKSRDKDRMSPFSKHYHLFDANSPGIVLRITDHVEIIALTCIFGF